MQAQRPSGECLGGLSISHRYVMCELAASGWPKQLPSEYVLWGEPQAPGRARRNNILFVTLLMVSIQEGLDKVIETRLLTLEATKQLQFLAVCLSGIQVAAVTYLPKELQYASG